MGLHVIGQGKGVWRQARVINHFNPPGSGSIKIEAKGTVEGKGLFFTKLFSAGIKPFFIGARGRDVVGCFFTHEGGLVDFNALFKKEGEVKVGMVVRYLYNKPSWKKLEKEVSFHGQVNYILLLPPELILMHAVPKGYVVEKGKWGTRIRWFWKYGFSSKIRVFFKRVSS